MLIHQLLVTPFKHPFLFSEWPLKAKKWPSSWHWFNKVLTTFLWHCGPVAADCQLHIYGNPSIYPKEFYWMGSIDFGGHWNTVNSTSWNQFEMIKLCDMIHYPAGNSQQKMGTLSNKGVDIVSSNSQIGTNGPKTCQENRSQTATPSPAIVYKAKLIHAFILFTLIWMSLDSSDQATFLTCCWAHANCGLNFSFLADRSGIQCGLLQRLCIQTCLVVISGYLSYCFLAVSL